MTYLLKPSITKALDADTATDVGTAVVTEVSLVNDAGVDTDGVALAVDTGVDPAVDASVALTVGSGIAFAVETGLALAGDKVADLNVGLGVAMAADLGVAVGCAGARAGACAGACAWAPGVFAPLSAGGVGEPYGRGVAIGDEGGFCKGVFGAGGFGAGEFCAGGFCVGVFCAGTHCAEVVGGGEGGTAVVAGEDRDAG
ncbi:hypothetical protein WJX77_006876 [Trebouxia sp. C0004]